MSAAPQSDYLSKNESDKLDKELDKIFEEMEDAVKQAGLSPNDSSPGLEFLPDDDDLSDSFYDTDKSKIYEKPRQITGLEKASRQLEPTQLPGLDDMAFSEKEPVATPPLLTINLAVKAANIHSDLNLEAASTYHSSPQSQTFSISNQVASDLEFPAASHPKYEGQLTTTMTSEQLADLIERTVEKALISAFKKHGSPG